MFFIVFLIFIYDPLFLKINVIVIEFLDKLKNIRHLSEIMIYFNDLLVVVRSIHISTR